MPASSRRNFSPKAPRRDNSRRVVRSLVSVDLPIPPSVNDAFASRAGGGPQTMKTAAYRFWMKAVLDEHGHGERLPRLPPGCYGLMLELPGAMRGDIDNRIKLASDVLVNENLGIVEDDGFMSAIYVEQADDIPRDRCVVTVVTIDEWLPYLSMRFGD